MKTMKQFFLWLITLIGLMMVTNAAQAADYDLKHNGLYYKKIKKITPISWEVKVVPEQASDPFYSAANKPKDDVTIPATFNITTGFIINHYTVKEIGDYAFAYCSAVSSVSIPSGIRTIGDMAFYSCSALSSVSIPSGVTTLGERAFSNCLALSSVSIPNSVTTIGDMAFSGCTALTTVTVQWDTPPSINANVFKNVAIQNVTLKVPLGKAGAYKAAPVWKDFKIEMPKVYDFKHNGLYYKRIKQTSPISWEVKVVHEKTIYPYYSSAAEKPKGNVTIPATFTMKAGYITYHYTVKEIGDRAFYQCDQLTSVTIPISVTKIGEWAFYTCKQLPSVSIPNSVTTIERHSFANCEALTSVSIPNSVTTIGGWAFINCKSLSSVSIPNSVTTIRFWAFKSCKSLTSVSIPNSMTTIEAGVFSDCNALTSLTIPNSVTTIDEHSFANCTALTTVTVQWDTPPSINANVFKNVAIQNVTLKVPLGKAAAYKAAPVWKDFKIDDGMSSLKLVTSVALDHHVLNLDNVNTYKLNATVLPADATDKTLTWTSSVPTVATVDGTGLISVVAKGTTVITATANDGSGKLDKCTVHVNSIVANQTLEGIKVWTTDGRLFLMLPAPQTVRIYNVSGGLVKELALPEGDTSHPLPAGFYIVQLGTQVKKVIVK